MQFVGETVQEQKQGMIYSDRLTINKGIQGGKHLLFKPPSSGVMSQNVEWQTNQQSNK